MDDGCTCDGCFEKRDPDEGLTYEQMMEQFKKFAALLIEDCFKPNPFLTALKKRVECSSSQAGDFTKGELPN